VWDHCPRRGGGWLGSPYLPYPQEIASLVLGRLPTVTSYLFFWLWHEACDVVEVGW
jgi:hypothetical protein